MNHETQQPYFTIRVTRCWECPHAKNARCALAYDQPTRHFIDNVEGLTPSCPMWAQVQQEKKDV